ncbi:TonB-dependent receptor [Campylobacter troglodytis]|uniref:TonB-dependent receptor n=1 Tax=Campylobacter troglodytis TaxID=654363 RepID=UPI0011582A78|nr:TonB-dependent receptor [Campylobacter troglodytis]TQR60919.1 hypothetical protein DMC01_03635 [Campylobacter troglodytis]
MGGGGLVLKLLCFFLVSSPIFANQTNTNAIYINEKDIKNNGYDDLEQVLGLEFLTQTKLFLNQARLLNFKSINLHNVELIEFTPNASGVLYGTRGSVVNIISKKAPYEFLDFSLKGTSGEKSALQGGALNINGAKIINDKVFISTSLSADYTPFSRNTGLNEPFQFVIYTTTNPWTRTPYLRGWRQNCPKEPAFVGSDGRAWYYECLEYRGAYKRGDYAASLGANVEIQYETSLDEWISFYSKYNYTLRSEPAKRLNTITPRCIADDTQPSGYACSFFDSNAQFNHLTKDELKKEWRYSASDTINKFVINDFQGFLSYEKQGKSLDFTVLGNYHFNKVLYGFSDLSDGFDTRSFQGSELNQHSASINFKLKHHINSNTLILGLDNSLDYANRKSKMNYHYDDTIQTRHNTYSLMSGQKTVFSPYIYESWHLAKWFDLNGGARLEYSNYLVNNEQSFNCYSTDTNACTQAQYLSNPNFSHRFKRFAYALDLTPNFKYSNTGNIYIKGELGFISPDAFEFIDINPNDENELVGNGEVKALLTNSYNDLQNERYFKAELGWQEHFYLNEKINARIFLAGHYTKSFDEIFFNQNSTMSYIYRNLGDTQRVGVDFISSQNLGIFHLSQSVGYTWTSIINANQAFDELKSKEIPFVPRLRANVKLEIDLLSSSKNKLRLVLNPSYTSEHTSLKIPDYTLGKANEGGYYLVNVGLNYTLALNSHKLTLSAGVRNLLDTLYSTYAQGDELVLAMGRLYFVEFKYSLK